MFKRVLVGLMLLAGAAAAEKGRSIPLVWKDGWANVGDGARIHLLVGDRGERLYSFSFTSGPTCTTIAEKGADVYLGCSRFGGATYVLTQLGSQPAELVLETLQPAAQKGK